LLDHQEKEPEPDADSARQRPPLATEAPMLRRRSAARAEAAIPSSGAPTAQVVISEGGENGRVVRASYTEPGCSIVAPCTASASGCAHVGSRCRHRSAFSIDMHSSLIPSSKVISLSSSGLKPYAR